MPAFVAILDFIKLAHAGQVDKGAKAPYWQHPLAVANTLPPFATEELRAAALLHDVIEDTPFIRQGGQLILDEAKFMALDPARQQAMRTEEVAQACARGEADPEHTPPVTASPPLTAHVLAIVEGVTNDDFRAPAGLSREESDKALLAHYQGHILALAEDRPTDPEALRLAEDRVLLKFSDMAQNIDKQRIAN